MVKFYQVGPCAFYDYELLGFEDFDWIVYWYESGSWDGEGEAVGFKDGKFHVKNLGHCSCYGPLEGGFESVYSVEEFLKDKDDIFVYDARKEVKDKVLELI